MAGKLMLFRGSKTGKIIVAKTLSEPANFVIEISFWETFKEDGGYVVGNQFPGAWHAFPDSKGRWVAEIDHEDRARLGFDLEETIAQNNQPFLL